MCVAVLVCGHDCGLICVLVSTHRKHVGVQRLDVFVGSITVVLTRYNYNNTTCVTQYSC